MSFTDTRLPDVLRTEGVYNKGFGIVPKAVMHDRELTLESKALYAYLCSLAGSGEQTFPYRETILRHLGFAKNTYYRHYTPLLEQGYLIAERPADKKAANVYTLVQNPKKLMTVEPEGEGRLRYRGLKAHGYGTIPRAVMMDERLSVKAKGLYAYFCSYCGAGDCAFPRKEHILYHLGVSEPTYYKALGQLRGLGYLTVVQRKDAGRFDVNDYFLNEFPEGESPYSNNCDTKICDTEICDVKICDTVDGTPPEPGMDGDSPYAKICDTRKCDNKSGDIKKRDTKNGDANKRIIPEKNSSSNSSLSITADGQDNKLADKLAALVGELAPELGEMERAAFLAHFQEGARGKRVRNLTAYLRASLDTWQREEPVRQALENGTDGAGETHDMTVMQRRLEALEIL